MQAQYNPRVFNAQVLCVQCHERPQFNDGVERHLYCGKNCAIQAKLAGVHPPPAIASPQPQPLPVVIAQPQPTICELSGCDRAVYVAPDGTEGQFCSRAHMKMGQAAPPNGASSQADGTPFAMPPLHRHGSNSCLTCQYGTASPGTVFCSTRCEQKAGERGMVLADVPKDHVAFHDVKLDFDASWDDESGTPPAIKAIYAIVPFKAARERYNAYRTLVESHNHFEAQNLPAGNETRRWYGTYRECLIGESEQSYPCASLTCRLCSIIRTDFDLKAHGKKLPIGAFGRAIYTSSSTYTADEFSSNRVQNSTAKAMILADVIVGKPKIVHVDRPFKKTAPQGYDSVMAKKSFFLAHDDIMVYTNDAVRPAYLVMYDL